MNILNICVDIDGTITDPYYWLERTNKYFNKSITPEQINSYAIHQVMDIDKEEYEQFYQKYKFKIHAEQKLREDAKSILRMLSLVHRIYFVTARDKELEMLTHVYLRRNKIPYDSLFVLGTPNKADKARDLKCNIFIEDSYENAMQLSKEGFNVLLLDTYYNRKVLNENIIRVYSWKDILPIINEMALQDKAI